MLTRITVQGFKSLQDVQVELGQINVFVGANGSGKSNLLEAIGVLSAAASGQIDDQALQRRGVRLGTPLLYEASFRKAAVPEQITMNVISRSAKRPDIESRLELTEMKNVREQPWSFLLKSRFIGDSELVSRRVANNLYKFLSEFAIFSPATSVLRGTTPDAAQRQPVGLSGGQLPEAVNELLDVERGTFGDLELDDLFELLDWVDEIAIVPPSREIVSASVPTTRDIIRFTDRWMADNNNQLSAYNASEGALYVLFALVLALHPKSPRLFAIDNFDQAMHPRLARATMRLFCQQILKASPERQALLTTHNPLVLDGLDLRDDRIRLFAVERNSQGATRVHRVQVSDEVLQATQEGLSLSNLWVMGRLGGVPDLF